MVRVEVLFNSRSEAASPCALSCVCRAGEPPLSVVMCGATWVALTHLSSAPKDTRMVSSWVLCRPFPQKNQELQGQPNLSRLCVPCLDLLNPGTAGHKCALSYTHTHTPHRHTYTLKHECIHTWYTCIHNLDILCVHYIYKSWAENTCYTKMHTSHMY